MTVKFFSLHKSWLTADRIRDAFAAHRRAGSNPCPAFPAQPTNQLLLQTHQTLSNNFYIRPSSISDSRSDQQKMDLRFKWGRTVESREETPWTRVQLVGGEAERQQEGRKARKKGGAEHRQEQRAENSRAILAPVLTSDKMFHFSGLTS